MRTDGAKTPKTSSIIGIPGTIVALGGASRGKKNRPPQSTSPSVLSENVSPVVKMAGNQSSPSENAALFKRARETSLDRQVMGVKENRAVFVRRKKAKKNRVLEEVV